MVAVGSCTAQHACRTHRSTTIRRPIHLLGRGPDFLLLSTFAKRFRMIARLPGRVPLTAAVQWSETIVQTRPERRQGGSMSGRKVLWSQRSCRRGLFRVPFGQRGFSFSLAGLRLLPPPPIRSRPRSRSISLAGCRGSRKVAILADPVKGQNAGQSYRPGDRFEIRREPDGSIGLSRRLTRPWNIGQGQRAGRRPGLVCGLQRPAHARDLSRLRSRQPGPLVRVPDRRRRLPASPPRCSAGLLLPAERHADHGEERRRLASSRRSPGTRPGSLPRGTEPGREDHWAGRATCWAAGSTRATSTSTSLTWKPPSSTCSGPTS